mmetsp:Transcript_78046/g.246530  ORF Transcript_78046/g.246530 Transcript_78046/m.246530 type:complete len:227 (-) Transcript_78046:921-1601(-)
MLDAHASLWRVLLALEEGGEFGLPLPVVTLEADHGREAVHLLGTQPLVAIPVQCLKDGADELRSRWYLGGVLRRRGRRGGNRRSSGGRRSCGAGTDLREEIPNHDPELIVRAVTAGVCLVVHQLREHLPVHAILCCPAMLLAQHLKLAAPVVVAALKANVARKGPHLLRTQASVAVGVARVEDCANQVHARKNWSRRNWRFDGGFRGCLGHCDRRWRSRPGQRFRV